MGNMASSLILHKRITTTLAKAKALRVYVEPILTKGKDDTTHSRRTVFSYLQDKDAVTILFREIAEKIANRPGGYTRIIKMENRLGDNAEMAMIELVDYNTTYTSGEAQTAKKATRRRGGAGKAKTVETAPVANVTPAPVEDAVIVDEAPIAEVAVEEAPVAEAEEVPEAPAANEENAEKGE